MNANQFAEPTFLGRRKNCSRGNSRFPPLQDGQEIQVELGRPWDSVSGPSPSGQESVIIHLAVNCRTFVPKGPRRAGSHNTAENAIRMVNYRGLASRLMEIQHVVNKTNGLCGLTGVLTRELIHRCPLPSPLPYLSF